MAESVVSKNIDVPNPVNQGLEIMAKSLSSNSAYKIEVKTYAAENGNMSQNVKHETWRKEHRDWKLERLGVGEHRHILSICRCW